MGDKFKLFGIALFLMFVMAYQFGQMGTAPVQGPVSAEQLDLLPETTDSSPETVTVALPETASADPVSDQAIRIRVIPHSNAFEDQLAKRIARYAIDEILAENSVALGNVDSARTFLANNVTEVNGRLTEIFNSIGYETGFEVTFGHHLFPEKQFNGEIFPAGAYESLVVRIGEGRGNNWWCFVNPGVCLGPSMDAMDFSQESVNWNFLYQARDNAQNALLEGDFSFHFSGWIDNFFGSRQPAVSETATVSAAPQAPVINWYLFDDEK